MNVTNELVKDAAEALVTVLKEVSLKVENNDRNSNEGGSSVSLESLEKVFEKSNVHLDTKMENVSQKLTTSIKDAQESTNDLLRSLKDEMKSNSVTNQEIKAEIKTLFSSLQSDMRAIKTLLESQERQRKLDFQISCADLDSFVFYDDDGVGYQSSEYVITVLKCLALGGARIHSRNSTSRDSSEEGRKEFRDKLQEQLQTITGSKMQFEQIDDQWYNVCADES